MACLGVARLGVAQSPWSSVSLVLCHLILRFRAPLVSLCTGFLVLWSLVAALGRLRILRNTALGAFERLEIPQTTVFVVLEMLRILSTTAFEAVEKPGKLQITKFAAFER